MIDAIDRVIGWFETATIVLCLGTAAVVSVFQVGARYLFNTSINSLEEISVYLVVISVFVGMARADSLRLNIGVDILHNTLSPETAAKLWRLSDALLCVISLCLAYYTAQSVQFSHMIGEISVSSLGALIWPIMLVIPIAFLIVAFRSGARTLGMLQTRTERDSQEQFQ